MLVELSIVEQRYHAVLEVLHARVSVVEVAARYTFWADTTVVHLLTNGVRLKTVPSRVTAADLQRLLADSGRPAGPPPIPAGKAQPDAAIEVTGWSTPPSRSPSLGGNARSATTSPAAA
jgi:hypothetical protein